MNKQEEKKILRDKYYELLDLLPSTRRESAQKKVFSELKEKTKHFSLVLSFASKSNEINLWHLNYYLASQGQLVLPRMEGAHLVPYFVQNPDKDLILGPYKIYEPNIETCQKVDIEKITLILVPGIAFDKGGNRLGNGKGYYDRLLSSLALTMKIGVGFIEQLSNTPLPIEEHDRPVNHLCLY
jgi:5-formyltetrahydrofolate cyclo-ligase